MDVDVDADVDADVDVDVDVDVNVDVDVDVGVLFDDAVDGIVARKSKQRLGYSIVSTSPAGSLSPRTRNGP